MMYFDSAATSFHKPDSVRDAVYQTMTQLGNAGRGAHAPTLAASRTIYRCREQLANLFAIDDPSCIAFTMNATESLNMAISGLITSQDHVITTACEHNSVLRPLYRKEREGASLTIIPADDFGRISYEHLEEAIRKDTKAIVITHASNVTGNVHDLVRISGILKEAAGKLGIAKPLLLVDASQSAGILPIDVDKMGIDILCFTGHKSLYGPQGTGGIYVSKGIDLPSFKVGGSGVHSFAQDHPAVMPTLLEAGTLNGHGIAGLSAGVEYILDTGLTEIHKKEMALCRRFVNGIQKIPQITFYGDYNAEKRTPVVSLNIGEMDSSVVSDILWEDYEICTRAGAHCAPLMHKTFGTVEQGIVRFSFSYFNTEEEIDAAIEAILEIAEEEA